MNCCSTSAGGNAVPDVDGCPSCSAVGARVDVITLKALLTSDGLRRGVPDAPRFCATATCPVVYFDNAAGVTFSESELTLRVHAKHAADAGVPVCYCFGYTPGMIEQEIVRNSMSSARGMITAEVQAGHCACEVRNPKGSCCLGDVARVERTAQELLTADLAQGVRR